jgi:hypothetical protein
MFEDLFSAIQTWSGRIGFSVTEDSKRHPAKKRGFQQKIQCSKAGKLSSTQTDGSRPNQFTAKCSCPWQIWTEEVEDENSNIVWLVQRVTPTVIKHAEEKSLEYMHLCHNHDVTTTHAERMSDPAFRGIPEALKDNIQICS